MSVLRRLTAVTTAAIAALALASTNASAVSDGSSDDGRLAAGTTTTTTAAAITNMASDCQATATYLGGGYRYGEVILDGPDIQFWAPVSESPTLGYSPRAHHVQQMTGSGPWTLRGYSVTQAGTLHRWTRTLSTTGAMKTSRTTLAGGWSNIRDFASSETYVYALRGDILRRYTISSTGALTKGVTLPGSWSGWRTISYVGSNTKNDMLLATTTGGALRRLIIPKASPTRLSKNTLRASGFANLRSLSTDVCGTTGQDMALMTVTTSGQVNAYYDRDGFAVSTYQPVGGKATNEVVPVRTWSN